MSSQVDLLQTNLDSRQRFRVCVIGASAGAVDALMTLLPGLPEHYDLPTVIVVHIPASRSSILPALLAEQCRQRVMEAEDKVPLEPGVIWIAPPDYHVLVEANGRLSLSNEEPVMYSRPSIDVLFQSAAEAYRDGVVGVILTGANSDGAAGLQAVFASRGLPIVQNPETAMSPTMPLAAKQSCPAACCLDLADIAKLLGTLSRHGRP